MVRYNWLPFIICGWQILRFNCCTALVTCVCLCRTAALFIAANPSFPSDCPAQDMLQCLGMFRRAFRSQKNYYTKSTLAKFQSIWSISGHRCDCAGKVLDHYCPIKTITSCWCLTVLVSVNKGSFYSYRYDPPQWRVMRNHHGPFWSLNSILLWSREGFDRKMVCW